MHADVLEIMTNPWAEIGLVSGVLRPIAMRKEMKNMPEQAIFNWEPHGHFGIYLPDTFWHDK